MGHSQFCLLINDSTTTHDYHLQLITRRMSMLYWPQFNLPIFSILNAHPIVIKLLKLQTIDSKEANIT